MKSRQLFATSVLFASLCVAQVPPQPATHEQEHLQAMRRVEAAQRGRFVLKGVVVDEQGKTLNDVALQIGEGRAKDFGFAADYVYRNQKVNGEFEVEVTNANSVGLYFSSTSYYGESLSFSTHVALPKNWDSLIMRGEKVDPAVVKRDDIRVVLEKHGKLAEFKEITVSLESAASGSGKVWDLAHLVAGQDKDVKDIRDEASLPAKCLYLDPEVTADGKLAMQMVRFGPNELPRPRRVRIVMKGDGGFIPVPTIAKTEARQYRTMKEAPEDGYQKELLWDSEALKQYFPSTDSAKPGAFFYVKVGKLYGKGNLHSLYTRLHDEAMATIVLHLQPDGSRNVEGER